MSDDVYAWRDVRFTLPAGHADDTLLTFRGASHSLTVARDGLGGATLEAWAKAQEQALAQQKLQNYVVDGPKPLAVAAAGPGTKALVVDRRFSDAAGQLVFQRQCYVAIGSGVAIVTATSREPAIDQAKKAAADVVQTLRLADS